jgi:hypothetical protein
MTEESQQTWDEDVDADDVSSDDEPAVSEAGGTWDPGESEEGSEGSAGSEPGDPGREA